MTRNDFNIITFTKGVNEVGEDIITDNSDPALNGTINFKKADPPTEPLQNTFSLMKNNTDKEPISDGTRVQLTLKDPQNYNNR